MDAILNTKSSSSLCFNKEEFLQKDFSVDKFVSECRKYASLETMLEDLGLYHKILCAAMIELINKDYADFVNLSSNLVGLDKSIKSLASPLHKLKNEIEIGKSNLDHLLESVHTLFSERAATHKLKVLTKHVMHVFQGLEKIEGLNFLSYLLPVEQQVSLPHDMLERVSLDFNLIQFHMIKVANLNVLDHKMEEVENAGRRIQCYLKSAFIESLTNNDKKSLKKVLRIYSVLNKENEVELCFREAIVRPFMHKTVTEDSIIKDGIGKAYKEILRFIESECCTVLQVTQATKWHSEVVPGYDFLVNAVWPEMLFFFEYVTPVYLYAPGDPQLFHVNFTETMNFLNEFERSCEVQASVQKLRMSSSYKNFIKKFNLDLYFQIRFQDIASTFEKSLLQPFYMASDKDFDEKAGYMLEATSSLSHCIHLFWDPNVFLRPLSGSFLKVTLQLISRYRNWAVLSHLNFCEIGNEDVSAPSIKAAVLIRDIELLIKELCTFFQDTIHTNMSDKIYHNIEKALNNAIRLLKDVIPDASSVMVKVLTKECCSHLKLISDIPRMYRKTNREVPSKPSGYVSVVFSPLTIFCSEIKSVLCSERKELCLKDVTEGIVSQCIVIVSDVLTSIKKMEDSLKILKRARDKPGAGGILQSGAGGAMTDDDKIRRQLVIDVHYIEEFVGNLGLKVENIKSLKILKELVVKAEKKSHPFSLK